MTISKKKPAVKTKSPVVPEKQEDKKDVQLDVPATNELLKVLEALRSAIPKVEEEIDTSDEEKERPPRETFAVKFTKFELIHLRDLFGIKFPPTFDKTVSSVLAQRAGRPIIESVLWAKLAVACEAAKIPLGEDAPDFMVGVVSMPEMSVFEIASEPDEDYGEDDDDESENIDPFSKSKEEKPEDK
jgi:hypothetical protein